MHNPDDSRITLEAADENATCRIAARIAAALKPGMVFHLHGDLGAGKTALVRGILNALDYAGRVKSPTYTLLEPYCAAGLNLRHFDLYRLQDEQEWESAGFRDEFDGNNILFIEWPQKAQSFIPPADIIVDMEILDAGRRVQLTGNTPTGRACLKQL